MKQSVFVFFFLVLALSGCRQLRELRSFSRCEFRLGTVQNPTLAGVNVQNVRSIQDVNLVQAGQITAAYASGSLPLDLTLNVDIRNPNNTPAALNQLEWILLIEGKEIVAGLVNERVSINPNGGVSTLPVRISTDLRKILDNNRQEALNAAFGLTGSDGKPSPKVTLKVKPAIMIGKTTLRYPGYINVNTNFGAGE